MIIDTSAWIDYTREPAGALGDAVDRALDAREAMTTDVVRLELLSGLSFAARRVMNGVLAGCRFIQQESYFDVEGAVDLFQRCLSRGETIRSPNDCLIAAIAIRVDIPVLHRDRDFDTLGRHTALRAVRS